jgi:hypothetical protein
MAPQTSCGAVRIALLESNTLIRLFIMASYQLNGAVDASLGPELASPMV